MQSFYVDSSYEQLEDYGDITYCCTLMNLIKLNYYCNKGVRWDFFVMDFKSRMLPNLENKKRLLKYPMFVNEHNSRSILKYYGLTYVIK